MYYVYVHTVPNGKMYVGKAIKPLERWYGGEGYKENGRFYNDILTYGWDNIKHEIIGEYSDEGTASNMEAVLIALLKTENQKYGYNQTKIRETAENSYAARYTLDAPSKRPYEKAATFFEQYNLPRSACRELIEQWIFNEVHREILEDRLLNDMDISKLVAKYKRSERSIKQIIHDGCEKLAQHL